ncbi:MAG: sigma-70 family RNA polymerase sigma factor [Flavobacteriaceae bacterium]|nr:sigma-70 family RNA polymerase sigma factor [Flavobacteriaceae bacterium]
MEKLEELLLTISYKEEDKQGAIKAFNTLYKEYAPFLSSVLKNALKSMGIYNEELYNTVMNNVFFKIYENPFIFQVPENANNDYCFKGWLSKVARNELLSQIKEYNRLENNLKLVANIEDFDSIEIQDDIYEGVNAKLLNEALKTLNERDRNILMSLYMYYEKGKNTPSNVLDNLCRIHKTTKPNIRKIKERAEKKIIEYVEKHSNLKAIKDVK